MLLYLVSVWLHILAAAIWFGGMAFLVLVVVPWMRKGDRARGATLLRETGTRFRDVGWSCFAILFVTGAFNLWFRGVRVSDFARAEWLGSSFGKAVLVKLSVFALMLVVSAVHDFVLGPRATRAIEQAPHSAQAEALRRGASILGRANVLFALLLIAIGVTLVRGAPW